MWFHNNLKDYWDLLILDACPESLTLASLAIGDIDGDGRHEIVTGGQGALLWYRPNTHEKGIIAKGFFPVGLILEDIDGDGICEVVAGEKSPSFMISWFKLDQSHKRPKWDRYSIDPCLSGSAHDLAFADIDGDGQRELISNAITHSGLFYYKSGKDLKKPWYRHEMSKDICNEGLAIADLNGDGKLEIVNGPDIFLPPADKGKGPSSLWIKQSFAPHFRSLCRVALADITGNGRPDIILVESEYPSGRLSWFENQMRKAPDFSWKEHPMDEGLFNAHSLCARKDPATNAWEIIVGEMRQAYDMIASNPILVQYSLQDRGKEIHKQIISKGDGTHQALWFDINQDNHLEIVGKRWKEPCVQIWERRKRPSPITRFRHSFIDRHKPYRATDILFMDVDGDKRQDVVCGSWWYRNPDWQRFHIGDYQVHCAFDIDGDGREELVCSRVPHDHSGFSSELYWLKAVDPCCGKWEEFFIGNGTGDWAHGASVLKNFADKRPALIVAYHSATRKGDLPEIFVSPCNPRKGPWPKRIFTQTPYSENMVCCDIDADGRHDIVLGTSWLRNIGEGRFQPFRFANELNATRVQVTDVNHNGRPDIIVAERGVQNPDSGIQMLSRLAWFENPGQLSEEPWDMHVIDKVQFPHSLDVADIDGDGEMEIVCGEHAPPQPNCCRRLMVYKKSDPKGLMWYRYMLDDRFEHHCGAKVFEIEPGRMGIVSHGWIDTQYVHLWEAL